MILWYLKPSLAHLPRSPQTHSHHSKWASADHTEKNKPKKCLWGCIYCGNLKKKNVLPLLTSVFCMMLILLLYFTGRIRTTPDFRDYDTEHTVLSLGLFPACYIQQPTDDRVFFRFEAAWDSSLHNSPLLNRVTSSGERIYLTMSAYLEVHCSCWFCVWTYIIMPL